MAFVITTRFYIRQQVDLVSAVAADNIPPVLKSNRKT